MQKGRVLNPIYETHKGTHPMYQGVILIAIIYIISGIETLFFGSGFSYSQSALPTQFFRLHIGLVIPTFFSFGHESKQAAHFCPVSIDL